MRSWLFVPGDSDRKLAKAAAVGADVLILDLEDSVAAERKPAARGLVADYIRSVTVAGQPRRPRLYVRINPLGGPFWSADVAAVMAAAPDGIVLPKPASGADVNQLSIALHHVEETAGVPGGATRILPIATETSASLLAMASYVGTSSRLSGLTWGAEDLSAEIGAAATRESDGSYTAPFMLARNLTLFTAIAAKVDPIDTVFVNFRDTVGFERECRIARRDGFLGKMAIHPDQVATINAAFTPSEAEIARARRIVQLFAENPGAGVISNDGEMLDKPHLDKAERLLKRLEAPA